MIAYANIQIERRRDLAQLLTTTTDEREIGAIGLILLLSVVARKHGTVLESRDAFRRIMALAEADLFNGWDQFRQLP